MSARSQKETEPQNTEPPLAGEAPANLSRAITKTILECPSLIKGERNTHGKYNYVSIDEYYRVVARIAASNFMHWNPREVSTTGVMSIQNGDKTSFVVGFTYEFDLYFDNTRIPNFFSCTIYHPFTGAQTSGSSMSYAEKLFMRSVFKVQTGEEDADASNVDLSSGASKMLDSFFEPEKKSLPAPQAPAPQAGEDWGPDKTEALTLMMKTFIDGATDVKYLDEMWRKNVGEIDRLKRADNKGYINLLSLFKTRKTQLKEQVNG